MINMLIAGDFCVRGQAGELLDDKRVEKISTTVSGITETQNMCK